MSERLSFSLFTTNYLGTRDTAEYCLSQLLNRIPRKYFPTKVKDHNFKPTSFSFNTPEVYYDMFPGNFPNNGYVSLYKVRGLFNLFFFWQKTDLAYLQKTPGKKFSTIDICFENGDELLSNSDHFTAFKELWLDFCLHFNALYGYCEYGLIPMSDDGWGMGRCLPRLHWLTYIDEKYVRAFSLSKESVIENCNISFFGKNALLEIHDDNPLSLRYPNEKERAIIQKLGSNYFWNYNDSRIIPTYPYKMPELDLSQMLM